MKSAGASGCTVTRARSRASKGACGPWRTVEEADMAAVLTPDGKSRAKLRYILGAGALGKNGKALVANLGKAAGNGDSLGLGAAAPIDGDLGVPERRHVRRVAGHDSGIALCARHDDHVDVLFHDQPVRSD